jgi:hypothetical protein
MKDERVLAKSASSRAESSLYPVRVLRAGGGCGDESFVVWKVFGLKEFIL